MRPSPSRNGTWDWSPARTIPWTTHGIERLADLVEDEPGPGGADSGAAGDRFGAGTGDADDPTRPAERRSGIGVARDNAFCFYYPDNLELLEELRCALVFFSPTHDEICRPDLDGLYLGGGYPELFAGQARRKRVDAPDMREQSAAGMPIYAECGGFMYLCSELQDHQGRRFRWRAAFRSRPACCPG